MAGITGDSSGIFGFNNFVPDYTASFFGTPGFAGGIITATPDTQPLGNPGFGSEVLGILGGTALDVLKGTAAAFSAQLVAGLNNANRDSQERANNSTQTPNQAGLIGASSLGTILLVGAGILGVIVLARAALK